MKILSEFFMRCVVLMVITSVLSLTITKAYKSCEEVEFCNRLRSKPFSTNFEIVRNSGQSIPGGFSFLLYNRETEGYVDFNVTLLKHHILKIEMSEQNRQRIRLPYVFQDYPEADDEVEVIFEDYRTRFEFEDFNVVFIESNVQVNVHRNNIWMIGFNGFYKLSIEDNEEDDAIAFDVNFPRSTMGYGLPEQTDSINLVETKESPFPYRLFNNDNDEYEPFTRQSLYGSAPLIYGYGKDYTGGIFVANAAETWVDIDYWDHLQSHFMCEGGALELYLFLGPTPEDVATQYASLIGTAPFPPLWALGYQQSRNSYESQEEIKEVVANFDNNDIPIDAIWGDVGVQNLLKPFTWNENFNDPIEMLNNLSTTHRKFLTHVNPYIPVDTNYDLYNEAVTGNYFIKNIDGTDFFGESIAGNSSWIDFYNEEAFNWYTKQFSYDNYPNTTNTLAGFCNNLNEPAILNEVTEGTIDKTVLFDGEIINRDIHNLYGLSQVRATYQALMNRDNQQQRPFVLTRSFFAGTQRYAAVWTGNNAADWKHLEQSFILCLNIALGGISFCGADVGGYYGDPYSELLVRWYQAGAWLPLFRGNSGPDAERREPYLQEEEVKDRIRDAIRKRYTHLPVFYTLFYENYRFGYPVIRPLFYAYPEEDVGEIGDQFFVGNDILVKVIATPNEESTLVYFPGESDQYWYDIDTPLLYRAHSWQTVTVNADYIPVFYASGSIIPRKMTSRRNTFEYYNDPYTLFVFLGPDGIANGTLYEDDFETFSYLRLNYSYFSIAFVADAISFTPIDPGMPSTPNFIIDSIVVYRPPSILTQNSGQFISEEPIVIRKSKDGRYLREIKYDCQDKTVIVL